MSKHIRIVAAGKEVTLPPDFSLDIELVNPIFNNDVKSGSLPFSIELSKNRHLVKNIEDVKSDVRAMEVEHTPCLVYVDDVLYHSGEIEVSENQEIKDTLDASINSYIKSLDELVSDMDCQDVPVKDKIQIGEGLGELLADYKFRTQIVVAYQTKVTKARIVLVSEEDDDSRLENPKMDVPVIGFSVPVEYQESAQDVHHILVERDQNGPVVLHDFTNVSAPYPDKAFCNARVCYKHNRLQDENSSSGGVDEKNPLYVLDAKRPGTGVCFYVLYFLDCLFAHLGLSYSNERLMSVEDMKRLAFYTTRCECDIERKYPSIFPDDYDLNSVTEINKWLSERGETFGTSYLKEPEFKGRKPTYYPEAASGNVVSEKEITKIDFIFDHSPQLPSLNVYAGTEVSAIKGRKLIGFPPGTFPSSVPISNIVAMAYSAVGTVRANIMKMYANNKNFPETSVKDVIDSMWASFGVRFVLDSENKKVDAYYIRDVLRSDKAPRTLNCKVLSVTKKVEKVSGFRMRYAAESNPKDQSKNVRDGVRDYETAFNYLMSASPIVSETEGKSLQYEDVLSKGGSVADINCYVTPYTGNAYRWKVDKEAKTVGDARVNLFEVASYKGISKGDCSSRNEDFIVDVTSRFDPIIFSDVNGSLSAGAQDAENIYAAFVDEDMLNENDVCKITFAMGNALVDFPLEASILTLEKWDPSSSENGDSPLQHYDWGNSIAVMRGGGSDARIIYYDDNYDGFGNSKYRVVSGTYAMTSDSMDTYGNQYDYVPDESDESTDDFGDGERFSLKITAYKHDEQGNPLTDGQGNILCADDERDEHGNIVNKIRSRGLFDTFMAEYCHLMLNRKVYVVRALCEVAALTEIPSGWCDRWKVGDMVCWINKVKTHATVSAGLEEVELEVYCL